MTQKTEIEIISKYAQELISISKIKGGKYPFRKEYLDKLIEKWELNPGKYIIDLEDLPPNFIINFNDLGENMLKKLLNLIKEEYGLDRVNRLYSVNFYLISDSLNRGKGGLTVGIIRKYLKFLLDNKPGRLDIEALKRRIIEVKQALNQNPSK